jgi:caffeoyl-CoA O-methyltransferase
LPLLAEGGILLVDNALSSGEVVDPTSAGESARAIDALNERIRTDDRVENVLLTVRDGINLVRRRRDRAR